MTTLLKKISVATMIGNVKKMVAKDELTNGQVLYRAIGIADSYSVGAGAYGEFTRFHGDFEVKNMLTNETFKSSIAFFDHSFTQALRAKLDSKTGDYVEFALETAIEINDKYGQGFTYIARPIVQDSVSRLDALRSRLTALDTPKDEPKDDKKNLNNFKSYDNAFEKYGD
jgi:hypothetical protein